MGALAGLALVGLGTAMGTGLGAGPSAEQIAAFCDRAGDYAPLVFIAAGASLISAFVPKTAVSVSAGALFGTALGSLLMVCVATLAAAVSYSLARWLARERVAAWAAERPRWAAVRRLAGEGGFRLQLMLRLAPVPTMLISYACGAAGARPAPFLSAAAVAVVSQVPWVYSGAIAGSAVAGGAGAAGWFSLALTVAASVALAVYLKRYAERELAAVG
ncbi:TVP38/TMEM64 family protein [Candidatus Laterigemmans baculatus]|uniref:TVP38/TMEM64 family protein n=1 Tax=Candidatus Laterigemmans baculatus TaxID=2770505 RepID=UPI0013DB2BDC|nr:VTT domain-containing protein [Candidatus Laterigemmans baculatus]